MRGANALLAVFVISACAATPTIQTGPGAVKSADGLNKVDGVSPGTLYMKPDYRFGAYHQFVLGPTNVTFERGSQVLDEGQVASLTEIFEGVAREAITSGGRTEAAKAGPCVALVNLALVDLEVEEAAKGGGGGSFGAVTLVMEVRDGHTKEALLRYGQRRRLGAGPGAAGTAGLRSAFKRFATTFQRDFDRSLPRDAPPGGSPSCQERAGLSPS